jgi:hypothetical protein
MRHCKIWKKFLKIQRNNGFLYWVLFGSIFSNVLCKDLNLANVYDSIIEKSIIENKDYFLKQIETKSVKTQNDSLLLAIIYCKCENNYNWNLRYSLIRYDQEKHESIFIEDSVITRLLLQLVRVSEDNGTDEEQILCDLLMEKCRPDFIKKYRLIVMKALEENIKAENRYMFELYCLILNKAEKDSILRNKFIYPGMSMTSSEKCMLGDSCAIDSVKEMYQKAESNTTLKNCAFCFKYLSSDTSIAEVLMTRWCSNKMYSRENTVRKLICITLAHIYPENPIFKNNRELFNTSDKRYALFYNKSKDEQLLLRIKELGGDTIPDSLVNYEVVKKRVTDIQNWYNEKYKTKITCEIQKPYFTKRNETVYDRGGMQSTPVLN